MVRRFSKLLKYVVLWAFFAVINRADPSPDLQSPIDEPDPVSPVSTAEALIARVTPSLAVNFTLSILEDEKVDSFRLSTVDEYTIKIEGNNGVSFASGYNYYLQNYLNSSISWMGDNLNRVELLDSMPPVEDEGIQKTRFWPWSYYLNICTYSYSMVWWTWDRWEREIDWMAMRGINMPLMLTGQEFIWIKTFEQFGLNFEDMNEFFSGPAFLAWHRMGNIRGWGGPLPIEWVEKQFELGKTIFNRMRELGMKPVLPVFAGHVPSKMAEVYPEANIAPSHRWAQMVDDYCCVSFVEPTESLYSEISEAVVKNLIKYFGPNDHLYNGDQYNEMSPSNSEPSYLASVATGMIKSLKKADPDAVWIIQGWMFVFDKEIWQEEQIEAYLSSVDDDSMIILDMRAENHPVWNRTKSFHGKPYIWCQMLNFGAQTEMTGSMDTLISHPFEAASQSSMVGIGLTMEGIENNPVMYDMLLDQAWMTGPDTVENWLERYLTARYGYVTQPVRDAWGLLRKTVYSYLVNTFPNVGRTPSLFTDTRTDRVRDLLKALELLLDLIPYAGHVPAYRHDLTELTRQVLADVFTCSHASVVESFRAKLKPELSFWNNRMRESLEDLEEVLRSNEFYLLGNWLKKAESWASSPEQVSFFRFNAINQITQWGPKHSILKDYAAKQWSGMVGDYYLRRWDIFGDYLEQLLEEERKFDVGEVWSKVSQFEDHWQTAHLSYPIEATGNTLDLASDFALKYKRFTCDPVVDTSKSAGYRQFGLSLFVGILALLLI